MYGAGFDSETCDVGMLSGFIADDESELTVMLMHGNMMGDDYNPIRESEIKDSGLTYLALGHIHAFSFVKTAGKTAYAYPGCPEGRGFDETGDKGVLLGEITKRGVDLRFKTVSEYRYAERSVDLTRVNDAIHAIAGVIPQSALKETCRLTLFGRCEPPDVESITNEFKDRFYNLIVRDRTVRSRDIWEDEGEDSLKSIFLAKLHRAYNEAVNEPEREKIRRAAEYGLAAFENHDIN